MKALQAAGWRAWLDRHAVATAWLAGGGLFWLLMRSQMPMEVPYGPGPTVVMAANVLCSSVAGGVLAGLVRGWQCRRRGLVSRWRSFSAFFLPLLGVLLAWFFGEWPGHFRSDQIRTFEMAKQHLVEPWLSSLWGLYAEGLFRLTGQFTVLALVNVVSLSWLLADVFSLVWSRGVARPWVLVFFGLALTSVPLALLAINLSHDILTAVVKLTIAVVMLKLLIARSAPSDPEPTSRYTLVVLGALGVAAALLRGENIVLLVVLPLVLVWRRVVPSRVAVALFVGMVVAHQGFRRGVDPAINVVASQEPDTANRYQLTLLLNPIGFMMANHYYSPTPERDREDLAKVIDPSCLASADLHEPPCYWTALRPPVTDESLAGVRRVYVESILNNPHLFLSNRVATVLGGLGFARQALPAFRFAREGDSDAELYGRAAPLLSGAGLVFDRNPSALQRVTHALREGVTPGGARSLGFWVWNGIPALLLLGVAACRWRTRPWASTLALLFGAPFVLFAVAVPASHVTYLTDVFILGFLWIPLMSFERRFPRAEGRPRV